MLHYGGPRALQPRREVNCAALPREILESRLKERNTNEADVKARLAEIDTELSYMKKYDHVVQYGSLTQMKRSLYRFVRFYVENQA